MYSGDELYGDEITSGLDGVEHPRQLTVEMVFHDDWLVNVLLSDGRVYTFMTEMWSEHGDCGPTGEDANFPKVIVRAKREALFLAGRGAETWGLDGIPDTEEQFKAAMNLVCQHTSDADFRRFIR